MPVKKRTWTNNQGEKKEAWVVRYTDQDGNRRLKTFKTKNEGRAFEAHAYVEVEAGTHVPDSKTVTVKEAGELWIRAAEADKLEQGTITQYKAHLYLHLAPFIGEILLSKIKIGRAHV